MFAFFLEFFLCFARFALINDIDNSWPVYFFSTKINFMGSKMPP